MNNDAADRARRNLFGLSIDAVTMPQAVARCREAIDHGEQLAIGVVNAAKIVSMRRNPQLRAAVAGSDLILADGQAVVWATRLLGEPLPERVAGIDLFMELLAEAERSGDRVYFLGARPEILAKVVAEVERRFPGLPVAGARHGYYQAGKEAEIAEDIRRSRTDILFVGMSSPRKELFLDKWGAATQAHVVHGVGGSFDIMAGLTKRAPLWLQECGLEWLYRAWQEPTRLGRRYLTTNVAFITLVGREMLRRDRTGERA
jgi:N-acetylglucosaminyldiphosphoundecaprenol N-acetyl-beta-D-mannosaminyltransferase